MLKLTDLKIPVSSPDSLSSHIASRLGVPEPAVRSVTILKKSIDARHKNDVSFIYTAAIKADNEDWLLRSKPTLVSPYTPPDAYRFPYDGLTSELRPVIVGMGPAGLFAALCLARAGLRPVILERGRPVEERMRDVEHFWTTGALDERSNVQYGEGGAGTFSDGKLTTGIRDTRIPFVLRSLVRHGAPEDILYLAKPHIGTDRLRGVVASIRRELLALGCDIRFGHRLDGLRFENGCLKEAAVCPESGCYTLNIDQMILAPGNSARDTFKMLMDSGVRLSPKSFSVGVRIEHLQSEIDLAQYGQAATLGTLPAADYKLAAHLKNGRSVYTFCVCPGGRVVASASEAGHLVTNGMSEYARDGENCNGGLLVSVTPADFNGPPLSGVAYQRRLERDAFLRGGGDYRAPAQRVGDFLSERASAGHGRVVPTYTPGVTWCDLREVLPPVVCDSLAEALPQMDRRIRGFAHPDAVMTAVETRSSSPVRIDRDDYVSCGFKGLYPCGEGAGYAGGIMSAAVDGIRAAEALCARLLSTQPDN